MDNYGIQTNPTEITGDQNEAFKNIKTLIEKHSERSTEVKKAVKLASPKILAAIFAQKEAEDAIKECSFLKYVSYSFGILLPKLF